MRGRLHESFESSTSEGIGTERNFGIVFAVVFTIIGFWPLISGGNARAWALLVAGVFLLAGFVAPASLAPLNRLWFRFGMLLGRIVSPVVMAILFYVTVMPTGLLLRLFRKDVLGLKWDPQAQTYWIPRDPPGPAPDSLKRQF